MNAAQAILRFENLPEPARKQVADFIDFLTLKYKRKKNIKKFKFDWAGGLSYMKSKYTSVQLQHHINTLR